MDENPYKSPLAKGPRSEFAWRVPLISGLLLWIAASLSGLLMWMIGSDGAGVRLADALYPFEDNVQTAAQWMALASAIFLLWAALELVTQRKSRRS